MENNKDIQTIFKMLEDMDDDKDNESLEKAMNYFCSMWDIREGMKYAIKMTINDQYNNHEDEQEPQDLKDMINILEGNNK